MQRDCPKVIDGEFAVYDRLRDGNPRNVGQSPLKVKAALELVEKRVAHS